MLGRGARERRSTSQRAAGGGCGGAAPTGETGCCACASLRFLTYNTTSHLLCCTTDRLFNDRRYFIDESKLQALGWAPRVSWEDWLAITIDWLLTHVVGGGYWPGHEHALTAHPTPLLLPELGSFGAAAQPAALPAAQSFLVYGASGWIGGLLCRLLQARGARWTRGLARLEDRGGILADVRRARPTHVLCAAGVTGRPNVDWCEAHRVETLRANVLGTLNLVDLCHGAGLHVTNFATGCIYSNW
jgi:UDP-glucose 4,6-dehydratase